MVIVALLDEYILPVVAAVVDVIVGVEKKWWRAWHFYPFKKTLKICTPVLNLGWRTPFAG
jgi:hypothetical protein